MAAGGVEGEMEIIWSTDVAWITRWMRYDVEGNV